MSRITQAQAIQNENELHALAFFQNAMRVLPDPRRRQGRRYPLQTVVVIALMAMVCGAEDAQAMEYWGEVHEGWLADILDMPHGPPTQDVFLSVFANLNPAAFSEVFQAWAKMLSLRLKTPNDKKHVAIDGKKLRRSFDSSSGAAAIHMVSAWSTEAGIVIGQTKTDAKSNEITAIPELLKVLDLRGTTITIDAMGCQSEIASQIVEAGGNYALAVKENQPSLHHDLETAFRFAARSHEHPIDGFPPPSIETYTEVDKGHGRVEERTIELSRDLEWIPSSEKWSGITFFALVTRTRTVLKTGKTSIENAYYIGSDKDVSAQEVGKLIRDHWSIENGLHWVLDMAFREDEARHRAKNAAQNIATLRHFAINVIKQDKTRKLGVANTRKLVGWDKNRLIDLLTKSAA